MIFKLFLLEELHHELKTVLSSGGNNIYDNIISVNSSLRKRNLDTGILNKMNKGSSRAVFHPTEPKEILLDDTPVKIPTVLKTAYRSEFDDYTGDSTLLGIHQNKAESNFLNRKRFGIISKQGNVYKTNENGVYAPVFDNAKDHSWLEMGFAKPVTENEFKEALGFSHKDFHHVLNTLYKNKMGIRTASDMDKTMFNAIANHQYTKNLLHATIESKASPFDYRLSNFGLWEHPVSKKKHLVLTDYGYNNEVADKYADARIAAK